MPLSLGQSYTISCAGHSVEPVMPHRRSGLRAPPLPVPADITVSVKQLVLAIGRSVCNRTAPADLVAAQVKASLAALAAYCDFSKGDLRISNAIKHLNETKRNAIAHDLGAGVACLIMQDMGYAWMGLAEDHIDPKPANGFKNRKRPDLVFDSGGGANEYIAVEAKGSTPFPYGYAEINLDRRLRTACTKQIGNVLGATSFDGSLISRGLASGFLGIADGTLATYRAIEAEPPTPPSWPLRGVSAAVSFPKGHSPMPLIAMRHYAGVMRLLGGHYTANRLLKQILRLTDREAQSELVGGADLRTGVQRTFMELGFVVGDTIDLAALGWGAEAPKIRFAIASNVLSHIQAHMMDSTPERISERVTLPTESLAGVFSETRADQLPRFVDFDGLAVFTDGDLKDPGEIEI